MMPPFRARSVRSFDNLYRRGESGAGAGAAGNLAAQIQAAGAGLGAVYPPATARRWRKARRHGKSTVAATCWSTQIRSRFALIKAHQGDRWATRSIARRRATRPIMATAAKTTIVEVSQLVALGDLDPKTSSPQHFVQRVFCWKT